MKISKMKYLFPARNFFWIIVSMANKRKLTVTFFVIFFFFVVLFKEEIILEFRFFCFKENGWKYLSEAQEGCLLSTYSPPKIAHIQKGFCIESMAKGKRITLCLEEQSNKLMVFFENIPLKNMNDFVLAFQPDVVFIVHNRRIYRINACD